MTWTELGDWWLSELAGDPAYEEEITPLLLDLLDPQPDRRYLDVGCGEGRLMARLTAVGAHPVGVDFAEDLLAKAQRHGPVYVQRLPRLDCFAAEEFDGAYVCLVLEHLDDHETLLDELARVVRPGGPLALVINHPVFTAPDSAPIEDHDGEILWRPGRYFDEGYTDEPAGAQKVRFHHRTTADLLTAAADAGWDLRRVVEVGVTERQAGRDPQLAAQRHFLRIMGVRWVRSCG
jgi:SAM-dependent methyltransferase